jgi:hypothetical protein
MLKSSITKLLHLGYFQVQYLPAGFKRNFTKAHLLLLVVFKSTCRVCLDLYSDGSRFEFLLGY